MTTGRGVTLGLGTLPAGVTAGSPATAVVTLEDNDARGVEVEPGTLTVTEGGAGERYEVVLESEPTGPVTVAVVVPGGTDVRVNPVRLTFTSGNWSEAQRVTVRAEEDEDALADGVVRLTHEVSGGDYGSETAAGGGGDGGREGRAGAVDHGREWRGGFWGAVVRGESEHGEQQECDGGLRHGGRDRGVGGLHADDGDADGRGGDDGTVDDPGGDHGRRGGRSGGGAVHGGVERGGERDAGGRERDGYDRGRR